MKAYIINLARSTDRHAHMHNEMRKTGLEYEFITGVEGTKIDLNDSEIVNPTWLAKSPPWPGVIGCAMSHLNSYRRIIEDGADVGLVLEDDVTLPDNIGAIVESISPHMTGSEAVLLSYFSYYSAERGEACKFSRDSSVQLAQGRVLAFPTEVADLGEAGAYLITREACELMTKTVMPVRVPADDWAFYFAEQALRSVRCAVPAPVQINREFRTTIDHYSPRSVQTYLRKAVVKIPLLSQALTWRRQRIIDEQSKVELVDRPADQRVIRDLSGNRVIR